MLKTTREPWQELKNRLLRIQEVVNEHLMDPNSTKIDAITEIKHIAEGKTELSI